MRFTYFYKTSDGLRHEEKIEASSREAAFEALRERGIKAIKVVSDCGSKANGEVMFVMRKRIVFAALAAGLIAGVFAVLAGRSLKIDMRDGRIRALDRSAQEILGDHRLRMEAANIEILNDASRLVSTSGEQEARRAVAAGYSELNATRTKLRNLFRSIYETLPDEKERAEANRLYTVAMDYLDLSEARLARSEKACLFLIGHVGAWRLEEGRVVFSDAELERKFSEFRMEL